MTAVSMSRLNRLIVSITQLSIHLQLNFKTKNQIFKPSISIDFFAHHIWMNRLVYIYIYIYIICLDYILWTSIDLIKLIKENDFTLKKTWWYPTEIITDTDYANDLSLLTNTPPQAECRLCSLEQVARGIVLYKNTDKTRVHVLNKKKPSPL